MLAGRVAPIDFLLGNGQAAGERALERLRRIADLAVFCALRTMAE
jgi:hypothetical protein